MLLELKKIIDPRGTLTVLDSIEDFTLKRFYMVDDMQGDRGHHAHTKTSQIILCSRGRIRLNITHSNGVNTSTILEEFENAVKIDALSWIVAEPVVMGSS